MKNPSRTISKAGKEGQPVIIPEFRCLSTWPTRYKNFVEFCVALALFVIALPFICVAAILVKLTSRGPAFYFQSRSGRFGKGYVIYKLRTMYLDSERDTGPIWSSSSDPRITPLGRILRRTHFDELPQLWNVLRGEMSLVGPRPERPEFLPLLEKSLPYYRMRLMLKPGITGLAQVYADTDLASVRRKLAHDLYYVHASSGWLDLRLLMATAFVVLGFSFPLVRRILRLPRPKEINGLYTRLTKKNPTASSCEAGAAASRTKPTDDAIPSMESA